MSILNRSKLTVAPTSAVYAQEQLAMRHHAAIMAAVKDAIDRGWTYMNIGIALLNDLNFVGKLLRGHKFRPLTLSVAHSKLGLIKGEPPESPVRKLRIKPKPVTPTPTVCD